MPFGSNKMSYNLSVIDMVQIKPLTVKNTVAC